jgi:2-iminobutanoate/2-iminopropanoate deaminase
VAGRLVRCALAEVTVNRIYKLEKQQMGSHMQGQTFTFGMPWEKEHGFCQAVRSGNTLYISGQLSHDMQANFIGGGDFGLQVRTTFDNLDSILQAYGASRRQIVSTTIYVRDLREHLEEISRIHREYFDDHRPTSTLLGVADLAVPEQLVEISAVAVLE